MISVDVWLVFSPIHIVPICLKKYAMVLITLLY